MATPELLDGTIKRILEAHGYGFIYCRQTGLQYFVHRQEFVNLRRDDWTEALEGKHVRFVPGQGPKGPRAESVELLDDPRTDVGRPGMDSRPSLDDRIAAVKDRGSKTRRP